MRKLNVHVPIEGAEEMHRYRQIPVDACVNVGLKYLVRIMDDSKWCQRAVVNFLREENMYDNEIYCHAKCVWEEVFVVQMGFPMV